jgi:hypothetical protein
MEIEERSKGLLSLAKDQPRYPKACPIFVEDASTSWGGYPVRGIGFQQQVFFLYRQWKKSWALRPHEEGDFGSPPQC